MRESQRTHDAYPHRATLGSFELRIPTNSDSDSVYEIQADSRTNVFNPSGPPTAEECVGQLTGWILDWQRNGIGYWVVEDSSAGDIAGIGGLRLTEETLESRPIFNLYYRFSPRVWGQGLATEVSVLAIRSLKASETRGIVSAVIHEENLPSQRVAQRAGLQFFGTVLHQGGLRQRWIIDIS